MEDAAALNQLMTLLAATTLVGPDAPIPDVGLQIWDGEVWIPSTAEVWRSYVGPRRVWGIDWHGPVYAVDDGDSGTPWRGPRSCGCPKCQEHVLPEYKPN